MKNTSSPSPRPSGSQPAAAAKGKARQPAATGITAEQLHQLIAEEAYLRAERRSFQGGDSTGDWLAAEAEITRKLAHGAKG